VEGDQGVGTFSGKSDSDDPGNDDAEEEHDDDCDDLDDLDEDQMETDKTSDKLVKFTTPSVKQGTSTRAKTVADYVRVEAKQGSVQKSGGREVRSQSPCMIEHLYT
jgi:hypothetical protein